MADFAFFTIRLRPGLTRIPADPWRDPLEWLEFDDRYRPIPLQAETKQSAVEEGKRIWLGMPEPELGDPCVGYIVADADDEAAVGISIVMDRIAELVDQAAMKRLFGDAWPSAQ
jgi:hypothetical protein